jgi:hypothetical protein
MLDMPESVVRRIDAIVAQMPGLPPGPSIDARHEVPGALTARRWSAPRSRSNTRVRRRREPRCACHLGGGHVRSAPLASYRGVRVARRRSRLKEKEAMRTIFLRAPRALAAAVATAWLVAWLVACGGGDEALETSRQIAAAMPLVDDEGLPMPPAPVAWPEDPSVRTGNGLYATEGQADVLVANGAGVEVRLEGSDAGAIDEAVRAAIGAPEGVPVLVRGGDLRAAVAVVERLTAQGRAAVWLVTP